MDAARFNVASIARASQAKEVMLHNLTVFHWFLVFQATSACFVVSPVQGVFRRPITPRVLKYFWG